MSARTGVAGQKPACELERNSFGELPPPREMGGVLCCPTHGAILHPLATRWPKLACPKGGAVWTWEQADEAWS